MQPDPYLAERPDRVARSANWSDSEAPWGVRMTDFTMSSLTRPSPVREERSPESCRDSPAAPHEPRASARRCGRGTVTGRRRRGTALGRRQRHPVNRFADGPGAAAGRPTGGGRQRAERPGQRASGDHRPDDAGADSGIRRQRSQLGGSMEKTRVATNARRYTPVMRSLPLRCGGCSRMPLPDPEPSASLAPWPLLQGEERQDGDDGRHDRRAVWPPRLTSKDYAAADRLDVRLEPQ